jgi:hypothetical protein
MSNMNSRNRQKWYRILAQKYGEYCRICGEQGDINTLVIDHINNKNSCNELSNLELLCKSCNSIKNPRSRSKNKILSPVCVDEWELPRVKTAEMEKNSIVEPFFRRWLYSNLLKDGKIEYKLMIDSGAEAAHGSQEAIKRYIRKIISPSGWAETVKDEHGNIFVRLKKEWRKESLGEFSSAIEKESVLQKEGDDEIDNSKVLKMNEDVKRIVNG